MSTLEKLFQPISIAGLGLRNRIIMAPMGTLFANPDGSVSERLRRYYAERAAGGVALVIVEVTAVSREGKGHDRQLSIYNDEFIPGFRRLVESVRRYQAKIALQINHTGRQTTVQAAGGQPVAPSAIPCALMKVMPRELTTGEVERLVEQYAEAVGRAREAGFDAVEFHGAHGYMICQFLSAYSNKRTDRYGGDLEDRMRFALEIVAQAKAKVGSSFPMIFRLSAEEHVPQGLTLAESCIIARRLQDAGVHCLDVSAGNYEDFQMQVQPGYMPRGCLVPLAEEIKKAVTVPVSVAGRINDPVLANAIIEQGKADLVSLGRPLLVDPELPNKARDGRPEDIRMCTACYYCIDTALGYAQPVICALNVALGKEEEYALRPTQTPKRVLVVGAGPGGMEAARVAALRGHTVSLYEQGPSLGGQLLLAAVPPGKEELATIARFFGAQLSKLKVQVKLDQIVTAALVSEIKPDAVVIATGSSTVLPDIPGAGLPHVAMARDVIAGRREVGQRVVVIGGGRIGCETAELLVNKSKDVTLVRMSGRGRLAGDMGLMSRKVFLARLRQSPVRIEATSPVERITEEGVIISKDGQSVLVEAGSVVLSPAPTSDQELADELRGLVPELHVIGDSSEPRGIADAIHEGFHVAREL
jgi:2,4-dienoyl-CoA reductase-like NADH-dependent reductase (Old Yellow Enzyme family)/thioredoxin reductase